MSDLKPSVDAQTQLALAVLEEAPPRTSELTERADVELVRELLDVRTIAGAFASLTARPRAVPPDLRAWGPFDVREELGRGRFGVVYRAHYRALDKDVALKLYGDATLPFEPRGLARVDHPNVVRVHGADVHDGRAGIWMGFVDGRTLSDRVRSDGPVAPEEAVRIGLALCSALQAIHAAGLVHQDVKPRNVMETVAGRIVLMDLGASLPQPAGDGLPPDLAGTPLYMAPEVVQGETPSSSSDIYSLGVLLFYVLTGTYPTFASTFRELHDLHARYASSGTDRFAATLVELRPEVPAALARTVATALAGRDDRYRTPAELAEALRVWRRDRPPSRGRTLLAAITSLAMLAGVAGSLVKPQATQIAAPAAAETSYELDAVLMAVDEVAGPRRLRSGDRVRTGDKLQLQLLGSVPLYVYVLNQDEDGRSRLLFPLSDCQPANPVPPQTRHRLPGTCGGEETAWRVSTAGRREHFLVLASPTRLPSVEAALGRVSVPMWTSGENTREVGQRLAVPRRLALADVLELARGDLAPRATARGLWHQEIVLENPIS